MIPTGPSDPGSINMKSEQEMEDKLVKQVVSLDGMVWDYKAKRGVIMETILAA